MKRNGIWQSQSRWQNGHYQSVKKKKEEEGLRYSLESVEVKLRYVLRRR